MGAQTNAQRQAAWRKRMREAMAEPVREPGDAATMAWIVYREADDRFYLVRGDLALPLPYEVSGHISELTMKPEDRLGCHEGFVPWPIP